mgnify:CR=1 FL=1
MAMDQSSWRNKMAFLFTPEDSFTTSEQQRAALLYPASKPNVFGLFKSVFWMVNAIAAALLFATHL